MITQVFRDKELQDRFERDGYVVFDFITPEQAEVIAAKFYELHDSIPGRFYSTAESTDDNFKKEISDHAEQVIATSMESVFKDYRKLGITFLCKAPGAEGKVPVHRDWMVVDESKYFSGTVWVPMSDVSETNGALRVLPGSHKFFNDLRSSSLPSAFKGYEQELWDQMITVPMRAGQAFLLNHAVIHASSVNVTDKERLILVCGIVSEGAQLSYYHGEANGIVEKLAMPDDMFMRHSDIGGRPSFGVTIEEFEYKFEPENRLKIQQLITTSKWERTAKPLFRDEELQSSFAGKGYLKIPMLSEVEVDELIDMLRGAEGILPEQFGERVKQLITSKITLSEGTAKIIDVKLEVKRKNSGDLEPIHQDWTYADNEDEYNSVTCWIPLKNVSLDNGALAFIEGSHLFLGNRRPSPQPQASYAFKGNETDVFLYLQNVDAKAGEAIIYDHRIFGTSLPNVSNEDVSAISVKLVHSKAKLCHYYLNPDGQKNSILKYVVDEAFFKKYDNRRLGELYEKGEKITGYGVAETSGFKDPEFTTTELIQLIKTNGGGLNKPLMRMLMRTERFNDYMQEKGRGKKPGTQPEEKNFWSTYSPLNIVRSIKKRVLG